MRQPVPSLPKVLKVIDLGRMDNAIVLPREFSLHEPETIRVLELVRAHVSVLSDLPPSSDQLPDQERRLAHRHETILVHGPRGSGKTTLLLSMREAIQGHSDEARSWREAVPERNGSTKDEWHRQVKVLPPVDPTLVEGDEVFLATIVANVLRSIEQVPTPGGRRGPGVDERELEDALGALAGGFRVLVPKATEDDMRRATSDPSLFAERLLHNAMGGLDLADCFHRFCIAACRRLGVKALLQPIDDADVSIDQGWSVLETVRRYLSNGRILPMMLGDLDLFGVVVQAAQWKHLKGFARAVVAVPGSEQIRNLDAQVTDLSDQYLLKLARAERRVQLPRADDRLRELTRTSEKFTLLRGGESWTFSRLLERAGHMILGWPDRRGEAPAWRLMSANTRELRGVLMWLTGLIASDDQTSESKDGVTLDDVASAIRGYEEVFAGPLGERPDAREPLAGLRKGELHSWQGWLIRQPDPGPFWRLDQPTSRLGSGARSAAALQVVACASLALRWRGHPGEQLYYFGAVLSPMTAWEDSEVDGAAEADIDEMDVREAWAQSWRLGQGEPSWLTAARVSVSLLPSTDLYDNRISFGCATRLPPKSSYRKVQTLGRTLLELEKAGMAGKGATRDSRRQLGIRPWREALATHRREQAKGKRKVSGVAESLLPTIRSWLSNQGEGDALLVLNWFRTAPRLYNWRYDLVDPWKGIAALGDLARSFDPTLPKDERREALAATLKAMTFQSETLTIAVHGGGSTSDVGQASTLEELEDPGDAADEATRDLVAALDTWLVGLSSSGALLPATAWAELARRFAGNLAAIDDELATVEHSVGADLERWVLAFLHHLLLVEADLHGQTPSKRGQTFDPRNSLRAANFSGELKVPFATNLDRASVSTLPVFCWIARCPLLMAVLSEPWRNLLRRELNKGRGAEDEVTPWAPRVTLFGVDVDMHTALCALVPRINLQSKGSPKGSTDEAAQDKKDGVPGNLADLERLAMRFLGLDEGVPETPADESQA